MDRRYYVATFGCRVNQADSAGIVAQLEGPLSRTQDPNEADIVVLNTCTVTHRSDADVRKAVSRIKRDNPKAEVIVTGCYAQRDPQALTALRGVSAVVGNGHKRSLPIIADQLLSAPVQKPIKKPIELHSPMEGVPRHTLPPVQPETTVVDRTRPFIKIQDGCDASCTYCIIPAVRGAARSAQPQDVVAAVGELVQQGYFEVVLTGIHLGTYGIGLAEPCSLDELVREVLTVPGLGRLRMSCIEPMAFPMALAEICREEPRLAPHFHLPLQSGSDSVLKRMVRPYRAEDFIELIQGIRARVPHACVGTDVIVGFPGETEADFEASMDAVQRAGVNHVHVFSYSDRTGTPSTRLSNKVDPRIIKQRASALCGLSDALWARYLERQKDQVLSAITLDQDTKSPGSTMALSDNYCQIRIEEQLSPGQNVQVHIKTIEGSRLAGDMQR